MKNGKRTAGVLLQLVGAVLALIALIVYFIAGASNLSVTLCLLLSLACSMVYALVPIALADIAGPLSVAFAAVALCSFVNDSITTFLDYFNGITMFQSGGNIQTVVAILALTGVEAVINIIACFMMRS